MFSIITALTSETWAFTCMSLLLSSGWSAQYCIWSFILGLQHCSPRHYVTSIRNQKHTWYKQVNNNMLPKFLAQTLGNSSCSFSSAISLVEVVLYPLKKRHWNMSSCSLNCNYAIGCSIKRETKTLKLYTGKKNWSYQVLCTMQKETQWGWTTQPQLELHKYAITLNKKWKR